MTGHSTDIYPPYPPDLPVYCVDARKALLKRFNDFKLARQLGLTDADTGNLYRWLHDPVFNRTCADAEVDPRIMTMIFERQLYLGCQYQASFAM